MVGVFFKPSTPAPAQPAGGVDFLSRLFAPFQAGTPGTPDQYGYTDPMAGLGPIDRYKYLNKYQPDTLMALAEGMMKGDLGGGFGAAGEQMAKHKAYDVVQQDRQQTQNLTKQWLKKKFPNASDEEIEAASRNPAILSELLAPPAKRNLVTVGDQIYDADADKWITPGGAGGGFDLGTGTDARALEYLVTTGVLTQRQAAEVAGGKSIIMPDGTVVFKGASDLAGGQPQIMVKPPGAPAQPAAPDGGGGTPASPAPPAPAELPQPGGAGSGGTVLTPPKSMETTEQKNARVKAVQTQKTINEQLDNYVSLVETYGIEAVSGAAKDKLNIARQGIMLQMKELYNLGVLTGPDMGLMEKMIYDPTVDVSKEGGWGNLPGQLWTGIFGGAGARAKNSADELKAQLDSIVRSKTGEKAPGAVLHIKTQAEYDALPSGQNIQFIDDRDGKPYSKP